MSHPMFYIFLLVHCLFSARENNSYNCAADHTLLIAFVVHIYSDNMLRVFYALLASLSLLQKRHVGR